jgi:hypothetical protein
MEISWNLVAHHLNVDAKEIRNRAMSAFPNDLATQREMRTRAAILESFSKAIWAGLE